MKQSVKTIVEAIEKEVRIIIDNAENSQYGIVKEFDFGSFTYDLYHSEQFDIYLEHWESPSYNIELEIDWVIITNENSKTLTNLSKEVFNQLEITYTNY